MELHDVFCPKCKENIKVNYQKEFNFCSHCGYKILTKEKGDKKEQKEIPDISKKLEEVAFYYQLSIQKKEAVYTNKEPEFYLKGQDLLVDLSSVVADDYRVWFELSKPLDYSYEIEVNDVYKLYHFNKEYFNKALDLANIEEKKFLIEQLDSYEKNKMQIEEEHKKLEEEEYKKQQELQKLEQIQQEERQRQYKLEEEQQKKAEQVLQNQLEVENKKIFQKLSAMDYEMLDNSYFLMRMQESKEYICVFKEASNLLYLMLFSKDKIKNVVFREQSLVVRIGQRGEVLKFDNRILRIKNCLTTDGMLWINKNGKGEMKVNEWQLYKDENFSIDIMKNAKKPLVSLAKIFY